MSLRGFLDHMDKIGQVFRVRNELSANFEIPQVMKSLNPNDRILLFEKVKRYPTRVVSNVCGDRKRICDALSISQNELYKRLLSAWRQPHKTKIVTDGPVKETKEKEVDLTKIPILKHFERDSSPYITSGVVHAKSIDEDLENVSVHRLQVLDKNHLAIRLVPRHLFKLWSMAKKVGRDLDVAVSIGVHPAVLLAASSPISFGVSEFDVANNLLGGSLKLTECELVNANAPKDAELVLEGRISAKREVVEGPFVDVTGTYDVQRSQPVIDVVKVIHRSDYIYEALLPSGAEHRLLMGLPQEVLIWDSVSKTVPNVYSVNLSSGGSGWLHAIVSIEKQVDGDGKNALLAAFAAHPSLKHAVVVDSDINVFDSSEVEWAIATRFQADEDLILIKNVRGSTLDSSADQETGSTTKMGMDATKPFTKPPEKFQRAKIPMTKRIESLVREMSSR